MKEETYKNHVIRSSARRIPKINQWKPIVQINWNEGTRARVKLWMDWHFKCSFRTANEAEMEGHLFAKRWIEDNNPSVEYERSAEHKKSPGEGALKDGAGSK